LREHVRRVVQAGCQLVQQGPVGVEGVLDRGLVELLLAGEVVVERSHPHVGGLGDLQDRDVFLPGRDEGLGRRPHQRGAGARRSCTMTP
jgi:hypothetical protein